MILGYEQPVEMPTMDIYSTDLMKAYIAGVKEQYDNAREDYKDFMKTYGDFYSPIAGDTEAYYNMTIGGAQNMLNDMYARGIDPLRNPEARAMINNYIASVPNKAIQTIKQNAENYKLYQQNLAKLDAAGLYNKQLEDIKLKELGLDKFSSIGKNGELNNWTRLSPIQNKTLLQLTEEEYNKFAPIEDITEEYKQSGGQLGKFMRMRGVSNKNKAYATEQAFNSLKSGPYWELYRKQAEDQVLYNLRANGIEADPATIQQLTEKQVRENIIEANSKYLQPTPIEDKIGLAMWEKSQDFALAKMKIVADRQTAGGLSSNPLVGQQIISTDPISLTRKAASNAQTKVNQNIAGSGKMISDVFLRMSNTLKDGQNLKVAGSVISKKAFNNWGEWFQKHGGFATKKDIDNAISKGILNKDGSIGDRFNKFYRIASQLQGTTKTTNNGYAVRDLNTSNKLNRQYYDQFATPFVGGKLNQAGMKIFSNTNGIVNVPSSGLADKVWNIDLSRGDWNISQIRHAKVAGYKGDNRVLQLQEYIRRNRLTAISGNSSSLIDYAAVPTTNGKYNFDITANTQIRLSDLDAYFNKLGIRSIEKRQKYLQKLGFTIEKKQGKEVKVRLSNAKDWEENTEKRNATYSTNILFVNIPITKTINNTEYEFSELNKLVDKELYGSTTADKLALIRDLESVTDAGLIK